MLDHPTDCREQWNITAPFESLRECGFAVSAVSDPETRFQTYDGNIRVEYGEVVTLGVALNSSDPNDPFVTTTPRTVSLNFPVRIRLQSEYTAPMTVSQVSMAADWFGNVCDFTCVCMHRKA